MVTSMWTFQVDHATKKGSVNGITTSNRGVLKLVNYIKYPCLRSKYYCIKYKLVRKVVGERCSYNYQCNTCCERDLCATHPESSKRDWKRIRQLGAGGLTRRKFRRTLEQLESKNRRTQHQFQKDRSTSQSRTPAVGAAAHKSPSTATREEDTENYTVRAN